jgi:hypothetical protein
MIKSFLKRVFSSSNEVSAAIELPQKENVIETSGINAEELQQSPIHKTILIERSWLAENSIVEIETAIKSCFEETKKDPAQTVRIRLNLEESLTEVLDNFLAERLHDYLDQCEQETMDLTFFLDKSDAATMMIYKTYLLPESVEQLNLFLQDRCMMIYETADNLGINYRNEIELFFQALDLSMSASFFEDFEQFKQRLLTSQEEEVKQVKREQESVPQEAVPSLTMIEVSREEVENENILQLDKFMERALKTPEQAQKFRGSLLFSFYGFGRHEDLFRMMNRKEIKDWASILVEKHPYIFYFFNDIEYPMTKFLTSLVVATEVENGVVYYNEEELSDFRDYIHEALLKLAGWLGVEEEDLLEKFDLNFHD